LAQGHIVMKSLTTLFALLFAITLGLYLNERQ